VAEDGATAATQEITAGITRVAIILDEGGTPTVSGGGLAAGGAGVIGAGAATTGISSGRSGGVGTAGGGLLVGGAFLVTVEFAEEEGWRNQVIGAFNGVELFGGDGLNSGTVAIFFKSFGEDTGGNKVSFITTGVIYEVVIWITVGGVNDSDTLISDDKDTTICILRTGFVNAREITEFI